MEGSRLQVKLTAAQLENLYGMMATYTAEGGVDRQTMRAIDAMLTLCERSGELIRLDTIEEWNAQLPPELRWPKGAHRFVLAGKGWDRRELGKLAAPDLARLRARILTLRPERAWVETGTLPVLVAAAKRSTPNEIRYDLLTMADALGIGDLFRDRIFGKEGRVEIVEEAPASAENAA